MELKMIFGDISMVTQVTCHWYQLEVPTISSVPKCYLHQGYVQNS